MNGLVADCRHALRLYRRTPGSSLIAVIVLAVGVAFVGAFASLYVSLAFKRLPGFQDGGRLVTISEVTSRQSYSLGYSVVERIAEEVSSLEAVSGISRDTVTVDGDDELAVIESATAPFFSGLRPKLALGRGFEPAEHYVDSEPVAVISHDYWQRRFDRNPDVLGETIEVAQAQFGGEPQDPIAFRIIGVMAPEMRGITGDDTDLWAPFEQLIPVIVGTDADIEQARDEAYFGITLGRLRRGVSVAAAGRELNSRLADATTQYPDPSFGVVRGIVPSIVIHRESRQQLELFLAGSVMLALVAAANVSLFLLARAPGRRREIAIRLSVGAPFRRLARQLASEAALLVIVAASLGLMFSVWLANLLRGMAFLRNADWGDVGLLDWRVLGLLFGFILALCLLIALAPVLGIRRLGLASSGRVTTARATPGQKIAGNVQIAIAGALGGVAIAFAWFLAPLLYADPGYEIDDRQFVMLIHRSMFGATGSETTRAIDATRNRELFQSIPGVDDVSLSFLVPGNALLDPRDASDPADPSRTVEIRFVRIDDRLVDVLGLRLLYGRTPEAGELGVSLVNQTLARQLFGRDNVVGEFLEVDRTWIIGPNSDQARRTEIVGVLADLSFAHPAAVVEPVLFTNLPVPPMNIQMAVVASGLTPASLQQQLQGLYDSGSIDLQPNVTRTLRELRDTALAPDKARGLLTLITAGLVVFLAAFGFYGTQRYLVGAGRREYAIRAALGAGPRALGRLVFRRGFALTPVGLGLGVVLAFVLVAWLRDDYLSADIEPGVVAVAVAVGLSLLLLGASLGPAREARRNQPAALLRED